MVALDAVVGLAALVDAAGFDAAGLAAGFLAFGVVGCFAAPFPLGSVTSASDSASIAGGAAGWNSLRSPPAAFGAGGASSTSITPFDFSAPFTSMGPCALIGSGDLAHDQLLLTEAPQVAHQEVEDQAGGELQGEEAEGDRQHRA